MKQARNLTKPVARKEGLVIQELPDEVLVYDLDRDRAHCLNETAAFVWQHCDGRTSTVEIARSLSQKVNAPVDEKVVWFAIDQLGRNHLMASLPVPPQSVAGLNRREMVRVLGIAAAVAVPVVASIVAPTPAQASTCVAQGGSCASGQQCCTGLSCNGPGGVPPNTCQ
jgi:coenzyme PQQ synthesis protein D (PqqD)